jgi:hypothetical protein
MLLLLSLIWKPWDLLIKKRYSTSIVGGKEMEKQLLMIVTIIVLVVVGLSGCFGVATKDFNNEYETNENTVLKISNINGQIDINKWDGDKVTVDATSRSYIGENELNNIEIEVDEDNNLIDIETKYLGTGSVEVTTDMIIKVPNYVTVDTVSTSNGEVHISGTKGNTSAHSSNGAVIIQNVNGYVNASTSNGKIEIKDTTGIKNAYSSNGDIYVEVFDFQENITISTSNGGISVYISPVLNADIEMTTSNGQVSISGLSLDLTTNEDKHKEGKLGNGGNSISITTSNGDIDLYKLNV